MRFHIHRFRLVPIKSLSGTSLVPFVEIDIDKETLAIDIEKCVKCPVIRLIGNG